MPRHLRWIPVVAGLYALALAAIGAWPTHVDKNIDLVDTRPAQWVLDQLNLTNQQGYDLIEFGANILLFVPFGLLVCALRPGWSRLTVVMVGALASATIEILQAVARPGRTADVRDVVANTLGAALGGLVYAAARQIARRGASDPAGS
jgi:glycopeptide antibiotics resistance protein